MRHASFVLPSVSAACSAASCASRCVRGMRSGSEHSGRLACSSCSELHATRTQSCCSVVTVAVVAWCGVAWRGVAWGCVVLCCLVWRVGSGGGRGLWEVGGGMERGIRCALDLSMCVLQKYPKRVQIRLSGREHQRCAPGEGKA